MKAAWYNTFGKASDVLQVSELSRPELQFGEVLVRLHSSGVNPSDVKKRGGSFADLLDAGFVVPHSDGAGVVEAVGEGVSSQRLGERVWVYQAQYGRRFGTAAEYVCLAANRAVRLPANTSFAIGACLGIPVMTAHRCVFADGDPAGQTMLVTGGAGRVGYYAIQWAKSAGATVVATASNPQDQQACKDAGADHVVNHRQASWGQQVLQATAGSGIDRVVEVEFGANLPEVLECIKTGGTIATYSSTQVKEPKLPFLSMMYKDLTLRLVIVYAMPEAAKVSAANDITSALESNSLQHRIAHQLPLAQVAMAHELVEKGGVGGCVIVMIDEEA